MNHPATDIYQACGFFMLRAPALPARPLTELLRSLPVADVDPGNADAWQDEYAEQLLKLWWIPGVADAVRVATPHLADAVERFDRLTGKNRRRAVRSLGRYLNRMSFRSTPFGLVAGVATGTFGEEQRTRLGPAAIGTARARPDSGWVMHLVKRLAFGAERPRDLLVRRNDLLHVGRGRVWLSTAGGHGQREVADARPGADDDEGDGTPKGRRSLSVRLTAPVRSVLDHARTPTTLGRLTALLTDAYPNADAEQVAALLDGLLDSDILITAERPRLLTPPADQTDRADALPYSILPPVTDPAVARAIDGVEAAIGAFNRGEISVPELLKTASAPMPEAIGGHSGPTLQIDAALAVDGPLVLPRPVAALAEEAAHVLARVGTEHRYPPHLREYADAFTERYGHRSEVPVLEALSEETGLGPLRGYQYPRREFPLPGAAREPAARSAREIALARLITTALARRELSVHLDDRLLDEIADASAAPDDDMPPPPVLDLYLRLMAPGPGREDWRAVCGTPGVGLGGRTFARFHDLLDADAQSALRDLAAAEERRQGDAVCAELAYLPEDARLVNISIRPIAHTWELPVNVAPGQDEAHVIRLEDVLVGVDGERLYLRSRTLGRRLHVTQRALLNWTGAPNPCRFLLEVSGALSGPITPFDWGGLSETMPFLPRVERGNLVLRRARWRLRQHDIAPSGGHGPGHGADGPAAFADAVGAWGRTWLVPRLVTIVSHDNTLLLDLTSAPSLHELRDTLAQAPEEGIVLEEVLPAPDEEFLRDAADEAYASEVVVPLIRTSQDPGPTAQRVGVRPARARTERAPDGQDSPESRIKRVGSDWLAVKLYAEPDAHDTLLGVGLADLAERTSERYGVAAPFFLRYADPAPHLRVRFFVPEEAARPDVLREVTAWAHDLARGGYVSDHTFVSYQREVERYGGPELIADAEEWFRQDSTAVIELLRHLRGGGTGLPDLGLEPDLDRAALVALSLDQLCACLIPDPEQRHALAHAAARRNAGGSVYRTAGRSLWTARTEDGPTRRLLDRAATTWRPAAQQLTRQMAELERTGELRADRDHIVLSLLHMHCNRMGLRRAEEKISYGVWRRLLDRAAHASRSS
ncbi:lantibiotic dehydratase [Streptomyces sp. NBC_01795]|uniref:lantibiotic dehydratase n=1 Tax=Streptomyces sp. NBC_01795 TaxID=2975943 RepID=UPI002DD9263C|nr:lantibiotic dehydratase [Streptomyces sp. NBC_01795]WSA91420.1 lantibiotic dehydratase [Streptomyces sp. NBC_01795]